MFIYANVNDNTEKKTLKGSKKVILHNNQEINVLVGIEFLKFILGDELHSVIEFVKTTIDKYV